MRGSWRMMLLLGCMLLAAPAFAGEPLSEEDPPTNAWAACVDGTVAAGAGVCGYGLFAAGPVALMAAGVATTLGMGYRASLLDGPGGLVLLIVGVLAGLVLGVPGLFAIGPCGAIGATVGGVAGAWLRRRPAHDVLMGALPGGLLAIGGFLAMVAGLALGSRIDVAPAPVLGAVTIVGQLLFLGGAGVSVLSGPVAVVGIATVGAFWLARELFRSTSRRAPE
ncbi:MAG: hypothetical protein AB2A00_07535 [Myxococcota bacterium]